METFRKIIKALLIIIIIGSLLFCITSDGVASLLYALPGLVSFTLLVVEWRSNDDV